MTPSRPSRAARTSGDKSGADASDPRSWPVRNAVSYGGVVVRRGAGGIEVALIRPMSTEEKQVWALPKGGKEPGEQPEDAAVREVLEETGMGAEVVAKIDTISYWFNWAPERVRYKKSVHFFLMRHTSGEPVPDAVEVAEVRFVGIGEAAKIASYPSERKVLKAAAGLTDTHLRA